jgi:HAD superfamily hydrolase (TIGR01662 family)
MKGLPVQQTKPEAILFDMGGVLLESADMWDPTGFRKSFPESVPAPASEAWFLDLSAALIRAYEALPQPRPAMDVRPIIQEWLPKAGIEPSAENVERWYRVLARWELRPLYPFVRETLQELTGMGIRLGLVSNTLMVSDGHRTLFREGGIFDLFEILVFSAEFGMNKPDPSIFRHALQSMNVATDRAWYVGDKPHRDIVGAHAVGMTAVLVYSPYHERVLDGPDSEPDLRVPDISALPGLLRDLEVTVG